MTIEQLQKELDVIAMRTLDEMVHTADEGGIDFSIGAPMIVETLLRLHVSASLAEQKTKERNE